MRVERSDDGSRIRLVADRDLAGLSNGWFTQPVASIEIDPATVPSDAEFLGFSFTQFAMPVIAGAGLDFDFRPAPNLHSPPACSRCWSAGAMAACCWRPLTTRTSR